MASAAGAGSSGAIKPPANADADDAGSDDAVHDDDDHDDDDRDDDDDDRYGDDEDFEGDGDDDDDQIPAAQEEFLPVVAIVGRPNVGKSTLFNRLVGRRTAIVEDRPGVTRDRLYGEAEWESRRYIVIDTGGLDPDLETSLMHHIRLQCEVAIDEADVVLFVVDAEAGPNAADQEIAETLRRAGKPVVVVANKSDNPTRELQAAAAHELGVGEVFAVSAAHGRGVADFLDELIKILPPGRHPAQLVPPGIRIAFIGRPNAGKSTLINALMKDQRVIVDSTPGTTRDPIYLPLVWKGHDLVVIDTAGLRRRKQIDRAMEKIAAIKSIRTMEQTQVVVLVIDASQGVTDQDQRIARMAIERGKGVVVVLNKWDLVVGDAKASHELIAQAEYMLGYLEQPWMVKTSVVGDGRDLGTGRAFNLDSMLEACTRTAAALARRISTAELNDELRRAVADHNPPAHNQRTVKLFYATQAETSPPLLVVSANMGRCLDVAWERYFLRRVRKRWGLRGIPVRIVVRERGKGNKTRPREDE